MKCQPNLNPLKHLRQISNVRYSTFRSDKTIILQFTVIINIHAKIKVYFPDCTKIYTESRLVNPPKNRFKLKVCGIYRLTFLSQQYHIHTYLCVTSSSPTQFESSHISNDFSRGCPCVGSRIPRSNTLTLDYRQSFLISIKQNLSSTYTKLTIIENFKKNSNLHS